jgi:hypothetical protein
MKVFVSYSFRTEDGSLAKGIERLLSSLNVLVGKGNRLAGGQLTDEVRRRIDECDGLVALMTRRERLGDASADRWQTHPWVRDEYGHARAQRKPAIALVEEGVETDGAYASYERIPFDRANPLEAFLSLSETLRQWNDEAGVQRVVQIRPDELGRLFRARGGVTCRYRFVSRGMRGPWVEADPVLQPSGTLLYLRGVQDDETLVEVEILQDQSPRWWSPATSQFISVEMRAWEELQ